MIHTRFFNAAKVAPTALMPLAVLAWLRPQLTSTGSSQAIDDAITTSLWWVALVVSVWMAGSILLWAAHDEARQPRSSAWLERVAAPGSKRVARVMLAATALAVSACSDGTTAPVLRAVDTIPTQQAVSTELPADDVVVPVDEAQRPTPPPPLDEIDLVAPDEPPPLEVGIEPHPLLEPTPSTNEAPTDHVVLAGDSLWSIAEAQVSRHDPGAGSSAVATYWRELMSVNAASLRSGEPNLIYVGETLTLPAIAVG